MPCVIPLPQKWKTHLHTYTISLYIYASAAAHSEPRFDLPETMKFQRHNAIRELVSHALVANQDELRRKLRRRGFEVTQATLSRATFTSCACPKGPAGYSLPNGNGNGHGNGRQQRR